LVFSSGDVIFYNSRKPKEIQSALNSSLLFEENLRKTKGNTIRNLSKIKYYSAEPNIFPNIKYALKLNDVFEQRNIDTEFNLDLVEVDGDRQIAKFKNSKTGNVEEKHFDFLFINPDTVQSDVITSSGLADQNGELNIDKKFLVHQQYPNIFAVGHCIRNAELPISPSTIINQSLTVAHNFHKTMEAAITKSTPHYIEVPRSTKIPIFIGNNRCLEIELDPTKIEVMNEGSLKSYISQVYGSKYIYYKLLTKGRWYGETGLRRPKIDTV